MIIVQQSLISPFQNYLILREGLLTGSMWECHLKSLFQMFNVKYFSQVIMVVVSGGSDEPESSGRSSDLNHDLLLHQVEAHRQDGHAQQDVNRAYH